jgi:nucleoside-diphosphate-sugar epimerase
MKKVLFTGARGFIGRRCLPLLRARGFEVHAVSSMVDSGPDATWHRCNLLDPAASEALLERVRPTHLLHLAWISDPAVFWHSPQNEDWVRCSERMLRRFYALGGLRAVSAGSCAEYAVTGAPCHEERTPVAPSSPYGRAKAALSAALAAAAGGSGWAWTRFFHPYGPGELAARFLPAVIDGLARGAPIACTHGRQVRDFIYIDDVAEACAALLECGASGVFNVGTGEGRSLRAAADAIVAQMGGAGLLRFGERPAPAYDPPLVVADVGGIQAATGWKPRVGFDEGIRRSIESRRASSRLPT